MPHATAMESPLKMNGTSNNSMHCANKRSDESLHYSAQIITPPYSSPSTKKSVSENVPSVKQSSVSSKMPRRKKKHSAVRLQKPHNSIPNYDAS